MKRILFAVLLLTAVLNATIPTNENVTKLYVATFNRAPDAVGLDYWVTKAGLDLESIAKSFFDQPETQEAYPANSSNIDFAEAVYLNLFNRASDQAGLDYWVAELDSGRIAKSIFILAVINGAQNTEEFGNDAMILENKTTVGLAFANAGLNDTTDARDIMLEVTDDENTVTAALDSYGISITPPISQLETLLAGNVVYVGVNNEVGTLESWTFTADLTSVTWQEIVDIEDDTSDTGSGTLVIDGMTMTYTCTYDSSTDCSNEEPSVMIVTEILEDYMLVSFDGEETRLYYDEVKARTYFLGDSASWDLETLLAGKTFYYVEVGEDYLDRLVFNTDVTSIAWTSLMDEESGIQAVTIEGIKLIINEEAGEYLTLESVTTDFLLFQAENGNGYEIFYFEEAKAREYLSTHP